MPDLEDVLELVDNNLGDSRIIKYNCAHYWVRTFKLHVPFQFGDQVYPVHEEALEEFP